MFHSAIVHSLIQTKQPSHFPSPMKDLQFKDKNDALFQTNAERLQFTCGDARIYVQIKKN